MSAGSGVGGRAPAHHFCTVIVTGMEKVAPWQPFEDDVLIVTAPARSILSPLALAGMLVAKPVWGVKVTPVVVQPVWPASAVMVPWAVTLRSVTA